MYKTRICITTAQFYGQVAIKIVNGYSNGKFGADDNITREQLAVMLSNYCKYKGKYKATNANYSKFSDSGKISGFAKQE